MCLVTSSQARTLEWLSGITPGAMPQVSGITPGAMPQVSGITPGAMPQVSGITPGAMPQVSGITPGAMPQVSGITPGAMPQVSDVTPGAMPQVSDVTPAAMPQVSGASSDEVLDKQAQGGETLVSDTEALKNRTASVSSMSGPVREQGGYMKLGPKLRSLRFSPELSPAMQPQGGQIQLSERQSNEIVRGKGNMNLLLGYEGVGCGIVSLMGGEDASLYSLGASSVATMYRVAAAISKKVARCVDPRRASRSSQDQSAVNRHVGPKHAAFDSLSQASSGRSIEGSSEVVGEGHRPDVEAQEFPGNHLVWYVLLKQGTLREYAGSQGIGQLVIGSDGLNTLGWGLGASSLDKSGRKNPSDSSASPLQEPVWSQDLDHSAEGPRSNVSVCKHFIKGWCRRGHECKLYHGDPPDGSSVSTVFGKQKSEEVHKVCPHFLKGNCRRGESCGYIHAKNAVSSVDRNTLQMSEQPSQETEVRCPHFDKGWCRRGRSCGFAHISDKPDTKEAPPLPEVKRRVKRQPLAEEKKQQLRKAGLSDVCFRWAQGYCDNASCRFSHRHLQAWERRVFEELLDDNEVPPKALHSEEVSAPRVSPEHTLPLGPGSGSASNASGVLPQPMPLLPPEPPEFGMIQETLQRLGRCFCSSHCQPMTLANWRLRDLRLHSREGSR